MYSQDIIAAHTAWIEAEKKVPEHDYLKGYKYRKAKANKLWAAFRSRCYAQDLSAVTVSMNLTNPKKTISIN